MRSFCSNRLLLLRATFVGLLLGFSVSANAGLFDDDEARKAIIELRGKVDAVNKALTARLDALSQRFDELNQKLEQRLERIESTQRGQLELQGQIETLKKELAEVRGKVEVQTNELARTQILQRDLASALENKVSAIDSRVKKVEPTFVAVNIDDRSFNVEQDEKRRFDAALALLRSSDFRAAAVAFAQFQAQYPESPYSANALYWNATSLFGLKDYRSALTANERFLSRFADHPRAADAALNIAFSQIELNDRVSGRKSLETVIEKYPTTDSARLARERLATLRK
jgi:tol-pal system protein YbgF